MRGRCVGDAEEVRGRCVGDAWEMRGRCVGDAWEVRGKRGEMWGAVTAHWISNMASMTAVCCSEPG